MAQPQGFINPQFPKNIYKLKNLFTISNKVHEPSFNTLLTNCWSLDLLNLYLIIPCLFTRINALFILLIYVDDILVTGNKNFAHILATTKKIMPLFLSLFNV